MKQFITLLLIGLFVLPLALSGCSGNENNSRNSSSQNQGSRNMSTQNDPTVTTDGNNSEAVKAPEKEPEDKVINVWTCINDVTKAMAKFQELRPDFGYEIKVTDLSNFDTGVEAPLDQALAAGGPDAPDIYVMESSYAFKYTQGDACKYAAAYKDLGIDVDNLLKEASIAKYITDVGTNPEGKLVGLGYQSTVGMFIYRRSIAKKVWGTEEPSAIKAVIGPGWFKFLDAAADLKAKGYGICSGPDDVWNALGKNVDRGWVVDGKLVIDPHREEFMDLAMLLVKNGYTNNTKAWTEDWFKDMKGEGRKKIFGFLGPSWLLNYVMESYSGGEKIGEGTYGDWAVCEPPVYFYWGGWWAIANKDTKEKDGVCEILKWMTLDTSETGLQYLWANGTLGFGSKDTVASATVMKKSDGKLDMIGGQNLFDIGIPAGEKTNSKNITKYDEVINFDWLNQVHEYTDGKKSRKQAIADFKKQVADNLPVAVE